MYFILLNYQDPTTNTQQRGWFHNGFLAYDVKVPIPTIRQQCPNVEFVFQPKERFSSRTDINVNTDNFISLGDA